MSDTDELIQELEAVEDDGWTICPVCGLPVSPNARPCLPTWEAPDE